MLFIAADAMEPPFRPRYFSHVSALNLLDNVPYPLTLIGQMDALLRPGGEMLLASPYEWREDITPKEEWLSPEQVRKTILGQEFTDCEFHYEILEEKDLAWTMRNHERYYSHFISQIIKASKLK